MSEPLEGMFDGNVVALSSRIDPADCESLGSNEAAIVAQAVAKRRHEFATGRRLAREALARFGVTGFELLRDSNRAPVWPAAIAGTLSHGATMAFAAVGLRDEVGTLGIDAEERLELGTQLWPLVLRAEERAALECLPVDDRGRTALVIFSAKESLYKAQYPRSHEFMEFSDLRVDIAETDAVAGGQGELTCVFQRNVGPFAMGAIARGRFRALGPGGGVLTAVQILPPRAR